MPYLLSVRPRPAEPRLGSGVGANGQNSSSISKLVNRSGEAYLTVRVGCRPGVRQVAAPAADWDLLCHFLP